MQAPTQARFLTGAEWNICTTVFGNSLPHQWRILLTDATGGGNAPFTIPTSALDMTTTIPSVMVAALGALLTAPMGQVGDALSEIFNVVDSIIPPLGSPLPLPTQLVNLGFFMNVGPNAFPNMTASQTLQELLVHEMAHVWQGHNDIFPMTYVINSAFHQCRGIIGAGGRNAAYNYTPGAWFPTYNAEQQASIVEDWYASGMPQSGPLWPYIQNYVRQGRAR